MQANTLTLSVDPANDSNPEDQVYTRHEENVNRSTYIGVGHTVDSRILLQLYRSAPKRNGVTRGTSKSTVKFTEDIAVSNVAGDGDIVLPLICEISFSVPVGATAAQTMELRQRAVSILDDDSIMADLNDTLEI